MDAIKSLGVGAITAVFAVIARFTIQINLVWSILGILVVTAISATVYQRFESNLSMVDYIKIAVKFGREQKRYFYVYRR